eukprot:7228627-Lingulodinium_polyedra.AAC.1
MLVSTYLRSSTLVYANLPESALIDAYLPLEHQVALACASLHRSTLMSKHMRSSTLTRVPRRCPICGYVGLLQYTVI